MNGSSKTPGLAKPREIAEYLGLSEHTVRRYAAEGTLPSYRIGGSVRFDRSEVLDTIASARRGRGLRG